MMVQGKRGPLDLGFKSGEEADMTDSLHLEGEGGPVTFKVLVWIFSLDSHSASFLPLSLKSLST